MADPASFWPLLSWSELDAYPNRQHALVVLPLCGFSSCNADEPLGARRSKLCDDLSHALSRATQAVPVLTLPPLPFTMQATGNEAFAVPWRAFVSLLTELLSSVERSGFRRVVFLNTDAALEGVCECVARDMRIALDLHVFCIHVRDAQLSADGLPDLLAAIHKHPPLTPSRPTHTPAGRATQGHVPPSLHADVGGHRWTTTPRLKPCASLSPRELEDLGQRTGVVAVIPIGAIEQHGPHLPLVVDAFFAEAWLQGAAEQLEASPTVVQAPALWLSKSNEHLDFPGTLSLTLDTFAAVLEACVAQLVRWGFRRIGILNAHGGNTPALHFLMPDLVGRHGVAMKSLTPGPAPGLPEPEATYGFHAGQAETALMLYLAPEWVRRDRLSTHYPDTALRGEHLRPEAAPATFAWTARDLSPTGVLGDAAAATPELGAAWFAQGSAAIARQMEALAEAPVPPA